jgi:hypothetical protein
MRNTFKRFGFAVLVTAIVFGMAAGFAACGDGSKKDDPDPELEGTVSITGTAKVERTLTAVITDLQGIGTASYQWYRADTATAEGTDISGATSNTYTLVQADLGKYITVTVTRKGYTGSKTSTPTEAVRAASTWTAVTASTFGEANISAIAWGNNKFVAVGLGGKIATSSDGITWTEVTISFSGDPNDYIRGIAWGSNGDTVNKFVAVGDKGGMVSSDDGTTWTAVTANTFGTENILGIAWGDNKFVAVGAQGKMAYSPDGTDWTAVSDSRFANFNIRGIAWGDNKFVAVGLSGKMAYSSNGTTWTAVSDSTFGTGVNYILGIAWGSNGDTVNKFVAVGAQGKMAHSSDGINWTAVTATASTFGTSNDIRGIAWGSNGSTVNKFVAVGFSGRMAHSSDGITWTGMSSTDSKFGSSPNQIAGIAWGNNKFVAVGDSGKMAYSPTGE